MQANKLVRNLGMWRETGRLELTLNALPIDS